MLHIPADQQSCAVDVVDAILKQATIHHASDIHLEPIPTGLLIRVRIDGVLHDAATWISDKAASVIARIKVLSSMNLAEHRLPQDGKFSFQCKNRTIDVRVSTFPCSFGEKVVLRLLDQERLKISLSHLGLEPQMREHAQELLARSFGFFLVAGPTGSGKTTTLYAALSNLNNRKQHIITLEDPIEYNIPVLVRHKYTPRQVLPLKKAFDRFCARIRTL